MSYNISEVHAQLNKLVNTYRTSILAFAGDDYANMNLYDAVHFIKNNPELKAEFSRVVENDFIIDALANYVQRDIREVYENRYDQQIFENNSNGDVYTPRPLIAEMIDQLDREVLENREYKILDVACKGGRFFVEIARRLYAAGHSVDEITNRFYTVDYRSDSFNIAKNDLRWVFRYRDSSVAHYVKEHRHNIFILQLDAFVKRITCNKYNTLYEFLNLIQHNVLKNRDYYQMLHENILELIGKYEEISKDASKIFGEVFTPGDLIEEMLDQLPAEVWENPDLKWLDPCAGVGNFPAHIHQRLMKGLADKIEDAEDRNRHILEQMLYMCELQCKNYFILINLFNGNREFNIKTYRGSFLDNGFNVKMREWGVEKFDIIVGNPPYNPPNKKGGGDTSGDSIWHLFVEKSFELLNDNKYLLFVHPDSWRKSTTSNSARFLASKILLSNQIIVLKQLGYGVFGSIKTDVDFYLLQKTKIYQKIKIIHYDNTIGTYDTILDIKNTSSSIENTIIDKILIGNNILLNSSAKDKSYSPDNYYFAYGTEYTKNNITQKIFSKPHIHHFKSKLIINSNGWPYAIYEEKPIGILKHLWYILIDNSTSGKNTAKLVNSKIYKVLISLIQAKKATMTIDKIVYEKLPIINNNGKEIETEENFYDILDFSEQEISFIENYKIKN